MGRHIRRAAPAQQRHMQDRQLGDGQPDQHGREHQGQGGKPALFRRLFRRLQGAAHAQRTAANMCGYQCGHGQREEGHGPQGLANCRGCAERDGDTGRSQHRDNRAPRRRAFGAGHHAEHHAVGHNPQKKERCGKRKRSGERCAHRKTGQKDGNKRDNRSEHGFGRKTNSVRRHATPPVGTPPVRDSKKRRVIL